ncbi:MAG: TVP38/TMEM64 family protein [Alphaproteobacteria bacterium]|nr:TVP38/TMEM64 family protein [Alphaproteobacteria bacterium]
MRFSTALRIVLVLAVGAGIIAALAWRGAFEPVAIRDHVAEYPLAPAIFVGIMILGSLVFIPRTILVAAGGLMFGLWWGLLWGTLGSTLGALAGFLLARYVNAGLVGEASMPRLAPLLRTAERGGWRIVAFLRLIPVLPHTPVNYALGLTRIPFASYAAGSLIGMVPMTFVWAELGATGSTALSGGNWIMPTLLALALLAASMILPRLAFIRRSLRLGAE